MLHETCFQDRDEAVSNGRQCLRKCKQNSDCISARKRCLCDGLCGYSCVRPDLSCDLLKKIDNGTFSVTGDFFNAKVTYTCDKGFFLSGLKERICQGDGSWSGSPPTCTRHAECGQPPTVLHARSNPARASYKTESVVEYSCFTGYEARGNNKTRCEFKNETIQWSIPEIKCIPISCGEPEDIENGHRDSFSQFVFNRRITFSCNEGFMIQGNKNDIVCQSNGEWSSPLPHCTPISCPPPQNPKNGRAIFSNTIFQSITRFECLSGYEIKGPSRSICNSTGGWTNEEKVICEPLHCEPIGRQENVQIIVSTPISEVTDSSIDPNSPLSSFVDDSEELGNRKWQIGTILAFRCAGNSQLNAEVNYSRCEDDAQWSHPIPNCMASCIVPKLVNATILELNPGQVVKHGSTFRTVCEDNYEIAYNSEPPTCYNGSWSYLPVCIPESCKEFPKAPANGIVFAPYQNHNSRGEYFCKDGFKLVGPIYTVCNFGKWTVETTPVCEEVFCKYPGTIANGHVLLVGSIGLYEYRSYVRKVQTNRQLAYECDKGYQLQGSVGSTCLNGEWYPPELPECILGNNHPLISNQNTYSKRKKRFIRISENFNQTISKSTCLLERTNNSKIAEPVPYKVLNSNLIYLHGTRVERLDCAAGFLSVLNKNQTAICLDGHWFPTTPICKPAKCKVERTVENALYYTADGHLLTLNSVLEHDQLVNIRCLPGLELKGANALRCYLGELSAVYVHNILYKSNLKDSNQNREIMHWPICLPENEENFLNLNNFNQEKKLMQLMIEDDLEELKKLKKNKSINKNESKDSWCSRPNKLRSILKHIDKLKGINQLKSKLIGIVELDHNPNNTLMFRNKESIYPPNSQILYRCIKDKGDRLYKDTKNESMIFEEKSSWLLTCSNSKWIAKRVPCKIFF